MYTPNHPPSTYFFSAGFRLVPPGSSSRFRRVPLPGSAGFRRVPPGPAGFGFRRSAGFRYVPLGSRFSQGQFGCAKFCRVSANKAPAPDPPGHLLLGLCQVLEVLARRLPRLRQSKKFFFAVAQVNFLKKSPRT